MAAQTEDTHSRAQAAQSGCGVEALCRVWCLGGKELIKILMPGSIQSLTLGALRTGHLYNSYSLGDKSRTSDLHGCAPHMFLGPRNHQIWLCVWASLSHSLCTEGGSIFSKMVSLLDGYWRTCWKCEPQKQCHPSHWHSPYGRGLSTAKK